MKYDNQLRYAADIVRQYDGRVPLSAWLKDFFRVNKQMGSRDRKTVAEMVYGYYRLGHNDIQPVEQQIVTYMLLSNSLPEIAEYFKEKYPDADSLRKVSLDKIFPYMNHLSSRIDANEFAKSFLIQPDLFLRIRPGHKVRVLEKLAVSGISYRLCSDNCIALQNSTKIESVLDVNKEVVVQDKSSQETGQLLQHIAAELKAPKVWDCCAASGGKSIMAYDTLENIDLTVSDIRESIMKSLNSRFTLAGITEYRSLTMDLTRHKHESQYDLVIADVPCSGSGTWARTPEQLYFFKKERIKYYSDLQKAITEAVVSSLKPRGYLIYITCSVFAEENEKVIEHIQNSHSLSVVCSNLFKGYNDKADTLFATLLTNQSS